MGRWGSAPIGDDHVQNVVADDVPVSLVTNIEIAAGQLRFFVEAARDVEEYCLEKRSATAGEWTRVASVGPGLGQRAIEIPKGEDWDILRLVELEAGGVRIAYDALGRHRLPARAEHVCVPPSVAGGPAARQLNVSRGSARSVCIVTRGTADSESGEWMSVVEDSVAAYWRSLGHLVEVLDVDTLAVGYEELRADLKGELEDRWDAGDLDAVHVIGDANDHEEFVGSRYQELWPATEGWEVQRASLLTFRFAGQPANDIVPTCAIEDWYAGPFRSVGGDYPYVLSDQPFVDFNGDGVAEIPITRWPARTAGEVGLMAAAMQAYDSGVGSAQDEYDSYFFVGDRVQRFRRVCEGML